MDYGDNVTTICPTPPSLSIVIHPSICSIHPGQGIHSNIDAGGKAKAAASLRHDLYKYGARLRSTLWECTYPVVTRGAWHNIIIPMAHLKAIAS